VYEAAMELLWKSLIIKPFLDLDQIARIIAVDQQVR
jgi:hypothetical protein